MKTVPKTPRCRECGKKLAQFGLCPKHKAEHVARIKSGRAVAAQTREELDMTDAELDQMIREQMRNLPDWWNKDASKTERAEA